MDHIRPRAVDAARVLLFAAASASAFFGSNFALAEQVTFSVGADETLTYPSNLTDLADEHTTIFPPGHGSNSYCFLRRAE